MAKFLFTKNPEEVCRERAKAAADLEFLDKIAEKKREYDETKNPMLFQQSYLLVRERAAKENEYYEKFLKEYRLHNDSIINFDPSKAESLKDLNEIIKQLISLM